MSGVKKSLKRTIQLRLTRRRSMTFSAMSPGTLIPVLEELGVKFKKNTWSTTVHRWKWRVEFLFESRKWEATGSGYDGTAKIKPKE